MSISFFAQPGWTRGVFNSSKYRYFIHKTTSSKPTFLLLHGFPSGPFTFRNILPLLKSKGYGIIMPELIGYGETEKGAPELDKFERKSIIDDMIEILDKEGVEKVVAFGHDHGSPLAASFARFHQDRTNGLVLASVAYGPMNPSGVDIEASTDRLEKIIGYKNWGYWQTFLAPHAPKLLEDHLESLISIMYAREPELWQTHFCPPGALEKNLLKDFQPETAPWATPEYRAELRTYLASTGLAGPLSYYHALVHPTLNFESETNAPTKRITMPYLFVLTKKDKAAHPILASNQGQWCDDYTLEEFDEGHWVIESDAEGVLNAIDRWVVSKGL